MKRGEATTGDLSDANFPVDADGRVYHLGLKKGECANLIVCVGDPNRAHLISSKFFDDQSKVFKFESNRGFLTYTGTYKGTKITVMAIGMGLSMADFFVREVRHIVDGPMGIIRLGTCGTPSPDVKIGTVAVTSDSVCVTTNYDSYIPENSKENSESSLRHFFVSKEIKADAVLSGLLEKHLKEDIKDHDVIQGLDITADSFYSSQGRIDSNFSDHNATLIQELLEKFPNCVSLQMETYQLLHLARLSQGTISVAACAIVLAQRKSNAFLDHQTKHYLEVAGGKAAFEALKAWGEKAKQ